jgi:uncharacterized protein YjbJ (UPF0337 family)
VTLSWNIIEGNWQEFRSRVKEQWSALTDDHLDQIAGERDALSAKLQDFYGISKDAADAQIDAFSRNNEHRSAS